MAANPISCHVACLAADLSPDHLAACRSLWQQEWPPRPDRQVDPQADRTPVGYALLVAQDGGVMGACRWIERVIIVAGKPHRIAGLAGVLIKESKRGQGHGAKLVQIAVEWAGMQGYDWAVLFCNTDMRGFYSRFGWHELKGEISVTRNGEVGTLWPDNIIMALPLGKAAAGELLLWRHASIDVGIGQW